MLKVVTGHMIEGNTHTKAIDSVHGEASSYDPISYVPQRHISKVLTVSMLEKRHQHDSNMDVPEACITAP